MNFSIRTRLTAWYVALLSVSIILFSISFFYSLSKVYLDRIDEQIESVAGMMVHTVVRPPGKLRLPKNFDEILERFFGVRTSGNYIQVLDPEGRVVARSTNLEGIELPISGDTFERARNGLDTYEVVRTYGVFPVRILTKPVVMKDFGLFAIIQVGSSLEDMEDIRNYMTYIFVFGLAASVLIAGIVGWFLARKALWPVSEITTMARRIGAESLDERIDIKGPQDEIGKLAATLNEMIERLEKSFSQIKQFTADASHELKTPLTVMKGEIEVALRGELSDEEAREILLSNLEEIDRMSYIIKNLLMLARADAEGVSAARTLVRFDAVLGDRFELVKKTALAKGVEVEIKSSVEATVFADPVGLGQVVSNLIDNAIKYTHSGGKVEISLEEDGTSAILKVKDSGVGISGEDLSSVFNRFYRTDKARTREGGSVTSGVGLGLSICKEIVESYNGTIEAESEQGVGSVFTVRLPLAILGEE